MFCFKNNIKGEITTLEIVIINIKIVIINIKIVRKSNTHNEIPDVNIPDPSRTGTTRAHLTNSGLA
jgi:hypothetical protein